MSIIKELYKDFMQSTFKSTAYTREKEENVASRFWYLVIAGGIGFEKDDIIEIKKWCHEDRYRPCFYMPHEDHYALAVHENHIQFCNAYEKLVGRKPFIGKDIDYVWRPQGAVTVHQTKRRTQGRLVTRCSFMWMGYKVCVTSFKDKESSLVACAYKPKKEYDETDKIEKRFTITHKQWIEEKRKKSAPAASACTEQGRSERSTI